MEESLFREESCPQHEARWSSLENKFAYVRPLMLDDPDQKSIDWSLYPPTYDTEEEKGSRIGSLQAIQP
jgi:hypothetical protein